MVSFHHDHPLPKRCSCTMTHLVAHGFPSPSPQQFSSTMAHSTAHGFLSQRPHPALASPPTVTIHRCQSLPARCSSTITCLTAHSFHSPLRHFALTVPPHYLLSNCPWFPFIIGTSDLSGAPALPLALPRMFFLHSCSLSPVLILYMCSYVQQPINSRPAV